MNDNYSVENIKHQFLSLFPAQYFSFITSCLGQIINGLFVGNLLSSLDMVALGFYNPYQTIISTFSSVISAGSRIVCGKYIGRGEKDKIKETFSTAIYMLLAFGVIATIFSLFFTPMIANLLGASASCFDKAVDYIRSMGLGILPDMLVTCLIVFLQLENKPEYSLYSAILLAGSNLLLTFGASKLPTFSLFTVGLVNSISKFIVLIFLAITILKDVKSLKIVKAKDLDIYKNITLLGLPSGVFGILVGLRNIEINKATSLYGGDSAVNALSIMSSSEAIYDGVSAAITTITIMLASIYYGEKDKQSIKQTFKIGIIFGELLTVVRVLVIVLFTDKIAQVFGVAPDALQNTRYVYLIYGLEMPLAIITAQFMNIYQSIGRSTYCDILYVFTLLLTNIFCCRVVALSFGLVGVWFGFILQDIVCFIIIFGYVWWKKKRITFSLDDLLFLDSDNLNIGDHITISINNIDDVMNVSKSIEEYCISQGVDKKRSMLSGLCLEELATNIIEHGFTKSKKKNNTIDIYCDVDDNTKEVNLRIKDNAVSFDPHIKLQNNNDPTTNIGIRLVSKIAKDMNYQNNFGLNVLTIKL